MLQNVVGLEAAELAEVFSDWNKGELDSFLISITAQIFRRIDDLTGKPLVDLVLDTAAAEGHGQVDQPGRLQHGRADPHHQQRRGRAHYLQPESRAGGRRQSAARSVRSSYGGERQALIDAVRQALYASKISAYAQGMAMLRMASEEYDYGLNLGEIAAIWRAGCIIRARFLNRITEAFERNPDLPNLLLDEQIWARPCSERLPAWRHVVQTAIGLGIPVPAFSGSLAYYDSYRSARLPANLIQAQRDLFGAHTYMEGVFH